MLPVPPINALRAGRTRCGSIEGRPDATSDLSAHFGKSPARHADYDRLAYDRYRSAIEGVGLGGAEGNIWVTYRRLAVNGPVSHKAQAIVVGGHWQHFSLAGNARDTSTPLTARSASVFSTGQLTSPNSLTWSVHVLSCCEINGLP
jgi:hypothetical protein